MSACASPMPFMPMPTYPFTFYMPVYDVDRAPSPSAAPTISPDNSFANNNPSLGRRLYSSTSFSYAYRIPFKSHNANLNDNNLGANWPTTGSGPESPGFAEANRIVAHIIEQERRQYALGYGPPPLERMRRVPVARPSDSTSPLPAPQPRRALVLPIPVFDIAPTVPLPDSPWIGHEASSTHGTPASFMRTRYYAVVEGASEDVNTSSTYDFGNDSFLSDYSYEEVSYASSVLAPPLPLATASGNRVPRTGRLEPLSPEVSPFGPAINGDAPTAYTIWDIYNTPTRPRFLAPMQPLRDDAEAELIFGFRSVTPTPGPRKGKPSISKPERLAHATAGSHANDCSGLLYPPTPMPEEKSQVESQEKLKQESQEDSAFGDVSDTNIKQEPARSSTPVASSAYNLSPIPSHLSLLMDNSNHEAYSAVNTLPQIRTPSPEHRPDLEDQVLPSIRALGLLTLKEAQEALEATDSDAALGELKVEEKIHQESEEAIQYKADDESVDEDQNDKGTDGKGTDDSF
ncbi:hypothetical protein FRC07_001645 [Ceratobasidium sp. 392]|nr:hypothetical protein FRC07_001645 [Ceratobasidium sp. 392]